MARLDPIRWRIWLQRVTCPDPEARRHAKPESPTAQVDELQEHLENENAHLSMAPALGRRMQHQLLPRGFP